MTIKTELDQTQKSKDENEKRMSETIVIDMFIFN